MSDREYVEGKAMVLDPNPFEVKDRPPDKIHRLTLKLLAEDNGCALVGWSVKATADNGHDAQGMIEALYWEDDFLQLLIKVRDFNRVRAWTRLMASNKLRIERQGGKKWTCSDKEPKTPVEFFKWRSSSPGSGPVLLPEVRPPDAALTSGLK